MNFCAAIASGLVATVITHPPDVVRTKMQLHGDTYTSVGTAVRLLWKRDGWRGFCAGVLLIRMYVRRF
jgi:hypothetical protein